MALSKVGVVGTGIIGEALISVLSKFGLPKKSIFIAEKRVDRKNEVISSFGVNELSSLNDVDVLMLAMKPQDLMATIEPWGHFNSESPLIVSFAAGVKTSQIEAKLGGSARVIRVMPNTPMIFGRGMSAISVGIRVTKADIEWISSFLRAAGEIVVVEEVLQDVVTATSGSGPAYFYAFTEAIIESAIRLGLSEQDAITLARETLIGAALMVEKSGKDLKTLRENVTSPNGTTEAALKSFAESHLSETVFNAMKAAHDRSIELSS
jgi:pyrroline-5-carboxylate reductase